MKSKHIIKYYFATTRAQRTDKVIVEFIKYSNLMYSNVHLR